MKKSIITIITLAIFFSLSTAVIADGIIESENIYELRQDKDAPGVLSVFKIIDTNSKEPFFCGAVSLKKLGYIKENIPDLTTYNFYENFVLREMKEEPVASSLFNFYQITKKIVINQVDKSIFITKVTEKNSVAWGYTLAAWIFSLVVYYTFLIAGFKRSNNNLLFFAAIIISVLTATIIYDISENISIFAVIAAITIIITHVSIAGSGSKKVIFISCFIYYIISIFLFYKASDIMHSLVLIIATLATICLSWILIKNKT